jgi:hypothetical protein
MKLQPEALQLNLSLLDQPPTQLPDGQGKELALALMELLLRAAAGNNAATAESSGGEDESEANN